MNMFVKAHYPIRLAATVACFALLAVGTLSACSLIAASLFADAHRCCKTSTSSAPSSGEDGCREKCAASASVVIPVGLSFGKSLTAHFPLPLAEMDCSKPCAPSRVVPATHAAGPPCPIYERDSALLI